MIEENPYYEVDAVSNSSLKYINPEEGGHPRKYQSFKAGNEKISSLSLDRGKLLHKWVENRDSFEVSEIDAPSDMVIKWVELVINSERNWLAEKDITPNQEELEDIILRAKKHLNIYNNYKDDVKIIALFNSFSDYYNFVKYPSDKIALTSATRDILFNCYQSLYVHPIANDLLFKESEGETVLNEQAIYFEYLNVPCKALLDRIIIDEANKKIKIIDLKTTAKSVALYKDTFDYYHTYRQLAFYKLAIMHLLSDLGYKYISQYKITCHIVAVETFGSFITQVYEVDQTYITKGTQEIISLLSDIKWYNDRGNWEITKDELLESNILSC